MAMRRWLMRRSLILRWVIVCLVTVGLLSAPFPAAMAANAAIGQDGAATQVMPSDMPFCHDQTKQNGCAPCPLLALCALSLSLPVLSDDKSVCVRAAMHARLLIPDDLLADGLAYEPPDHPPRTVI
jgi:hypothetical protein